MMSVLDRPTLEHEENWREWVRKIPSINFKNDWAVTVIPPFASAMARFLVKKNNKEVSVYLDCYDNLGFVGEPYWEIHPYKDDVHRVLMNDIDELTQLLSEVLD